MYVYLLYNNVNGKYYVGKTVHRNLNSYLSVKRWAAKYGTCHGMPIVHALRKHGIANFDVHILAHAASSTQLNELERLWIIALDARNHSVGYNICAGGDVGRSGLKTSDETKQKIGAANRGRKPVGYVRTEEHKRQLRERMKGNRHGRKITPELARQWKALETPEQKVKRHAAIKRSWDRRKLAQTG